MSRRQGFVRQDGTSCSKLGRWVQALSASGRFQQRGESYGASLLVRPA
jgi:hypothetical protein